jgi:hypothetical protein
MKRLLVVILIIALFISSCGQTSQNSGVLSSMLSSIPSNLATSYVLWFSNMARIKYLAGVEPNIDVNDFVNKTTEKEVYRLRMNLMAGYTLSDFSGGSHLEQWQDTFGFNAFDTSQEIWGMKLIQPEESSSVFSVMKGNFDKNNIVGKLNNLGYQPKAYGSLEYYSIRADNQVDLKSSQAANIAMAYLNRVMVEEREIIAAPADDIVFSVIKSRSDKQKSLKDSLAYTRVAESLGDVLGAALVPQSLLRSENMSSDWGKLHKYDLAGIGYQVEGEDCELVIILHYPDKSAVGDVDEMTRRMAEYAVTAGNMKTPLLSDLFNIGNPKAIVFGPDSILKVEMVYKPDTSRTLWNELVVSQDLGFLVSSP